MNFEIIGIPLTFIVLAAIMLWLIILGKGPWWLKAIFVPTVLYFSLVIWTSLTQIAGWATDNHMPERFAIHWVIVKEPSKTNPSDKGAIFFWATEINEFNEAAKTDVSSWLQPFSSRKTVVEPRSYRMEYSQEMHEQAQNALQKLMQGKPVVGEAKSKSGRPSDGDGKDKSSKTKDGGGSLSREQEIMFYELPPARLPEKVKNGS